MRVVIRCRGYKARRITLTHVRHVTTLTRHVSRPNVDIELWRHEPSGWEYEHASPATDCRFDLHDGYEIVVKPEVAERIGMTRRVVA